MGPTYLVLLRAADAAIVLYDGTDQDAAQSTYDDAYAQHMSRGDGTTAVYLVTVRAEARLS